MRRALRRAGWALAAAGGIGIAGPAAAQPPVMRIVGPGGHVVEETGQVILMTEGQARLEEGQVELGLLADPMLFSYGLGAHVQGATVEVRGFVPTEAVRDQALKVAREQTALPVVDRLKLEPRLATHCSVDKPENIQRAAKELLEEAFPADGRGMDVKCDARGRVTVTGKVASHEDRLLVSRKLRQVSGCSCVANHLELAGAEPEARPAERTSALVVPDAPPVTAKPAVRKWEPLAPVVPARPVSVPSRVTSDPPSLSMPRVDMGPIAQPPVPPLPPVPSRPVPPPVPKAVDPPTLVMPRAYQEPVALPPVPAVPSRPATPPAPKDIDPPTLVMPRVYKEPVALPPVPAVPSRPATPPAPKDIDPPTLVKPRVYKEPVALPPAPAPVVLKPLPEAAPKRPLPPPLDVPPPPVKPESRPPVTAPSIDKGRPYATGTPGAAALDLPPVEHPKPPSAVKLPEVVIEPGHAPHPTALPAVPPAPRPAVSPLPALPTIEKHDRGASEESYVSEGTITLDDDPPPVRPAARGVKAPPAPVKPAEGTLTLTPPPMPPMRPASAPVSLSVPPPKPPAPAPPPRPTVTPAVPAAVRLKERIQGVCGKGYEVKVTTRGKNYLELVISGPTPGEETRVMERIRPVLASPEFAGIEFNVDVFTPVK